MSYFQSRHVLIALFVSLLLFIILFVATGFSQERWIDIDVRKADSIRWRASMAFAYSCLIMLAVTLSMGSVNLIRSKSNPTHNALRRAFGVSTAVLALLHISMAITIHWEGWALWWQFIQVNDSGFPVTPRLDLHGIANNIGLVVAGIFVTLIALSTNQAISKLGLHRWKRAQQITYLSTILIFIHGLIYQNIEERSILVRAVFILIFIYGIAIQIAGIWMRTKRKFKQSRRSALLESET